MNPVSDGSRSDEIARVRRAQELAHGAGHDYESGSPHLKHPALHAWVVDHLRAVVSAVSAEDGVAPEVLEVGAGHGTFTQKLLGAGARVTVTEMSRPSADLLRDRFAGDDRVRVIYDPEGECPSAGLVDAVFYTSVLHHIPDYLAAVRRSVALIRPGGAFAAFQDPLWYPRQTRLARGLSKACYLGWRLGQGNLRRGAATSMRRLRGVYDATEPSDVAEYHVVREGLDEMLVQRALTEQFDSVRLLRYWSSQAGWAQALGQRLFPPNTFGIVALRHRDLR